MSMGMVLLVFYNTLQKSWPQDAQTGWTIKSRHTLRVRGRILAWRCTFDTCFAGLVSTTTRTGSQSCRATAGQERELVARRGALQWPWCCGAYGECGVLCGGGDIHLLLVLLGICKEWYSFVSENC